jgi:hypothetical protein
MYNALPYVVCFGVVSPVVCDHNYFYICKTMTRVCKGNCENDL